MENAGNCTFSKEWRPCNQSDNTVVLVQSASNTNWLCVCPLPVCVSGQLPVEYMRGKPLCMELFPLLFSSCRIPGPKHDYITHHGRSRRSPTHITVVRNYQVGRADQQHIILPFASLCCTTLLVFKLYNIEDMSHLVSWHSQSKLITWRRILCVHTYGLFSSVWTSVEISLCCIFAFTLPDCSQSRACKQKSPGITSSVLIRPSVRNMSSHENRDFGSEGHQNKSHFVSVAKWDGLCDVSYQLWCKDT